MDKGCVSYVVINKYYYQYILYDVGSNLFTCNVFALATKVVHISDTIQGEEDLF